MIVDKNKKNRSNNLSGKKDENQSFHVKHNKKLDDLLVCGMRPVIEAVTSGRQVDKILIQSNADSQLSREVRSLAKEAGIPVQFVPQEKLNSMTTVNHQGVVATISPITFYSFADLLETVAENGKTPFFVLLDHVTDVRNFGAIVRTAECAGVDAVIVPDRGSAQIGADAIKSSSGALLRLPVCRESNLKTVLNLARQSGLQICAATEKGATMYTEVDFTLPTLLVMGAEETGITPELLKLSDVRAKLPITGEVQSLNVSVAAGVFAYEMLRQRSLVKKD